MVSYVDPIFTLYGEIYIVCSVYYDLYGDYRLYTDMLHDLHYHNIVSLDDAIICLYDYKNNWADFLEQRYPAKFVQDFHNILNTIVFEEDRQNFYVR